MRRDLDDALTELAARRPDVTLVVADVGSFPHFRASHPDRLFNVGVAESLSVGFAAGLASEGRQVFLFSVAGFTLYRAFEQLKFSVGYWQQDVTLIGTGFGWRYFQIGRGHRTPDDLALMGLVPNMRLLVPSTAETLRAMLDDPKPGPTFIRLSDEFDTEVAPEIPSLGQLATVAVLGTLRRPLTRIVDRLRAEGYDLGLVAIEDLDPQFLAATLSPDNRFIVIEDHVASGGLAAQLRSAGHNVVAHYHLPVEVDVIAGTREELLRLMGFDTLSLDRWLRMRCASIEPVAQGPTGNVGAR